MRRIFVDSLYSIAILSRRGQWHQAALFASRSLVNCRLVTTDEVLTEVLNAFSETGPILRHQAAVLASDLFSETGTTVLAQSRSTFDAGFALYEARNDKGFSLTDCTSMVTMRNEGISEVLTNDSHFVQEGFLKLL